MKKHMILLIEDSEADACLLQRRLKDYFGGAFHISHFTMLEPAEKFIREKIDEIFTIVTDLSLPDTTGGQETFSRVKEHSRDNIPIIVMTGSDDPALKLSLTEQGADGYLSKDLLFNKPVYLNDALYSALQKTKKWSAKMDEAAPWIDPFRSPAKA